MNELLKVFVYGTLKPGESNYAAYCQEKVIQQKRVYTFGKLYYLKALGYPAMTLGTDKVCGYLLTFNDPTHLQKLDQLEDYVPGRSQQENEYQRDVIEVYSNSKSPKEECWTYLMTPDKIELYQGLVLPSGWFYG